MDQETDAVNTYNVPHWLAAILEAIVAVIVIAMVLLISVDVVLRYFFHSPIIGSFELIRFMMALLIFSAIPLVSARNEQISISLMDNLFHGSAKRFQTIIIGAVNCGALGLIAYLLIQQGSSLSKLGKTTGDLKLPMGLLAYTMAMLSFVALIVQITITLRAMRIEGRAND